MSVTSDSQGQRVVGEIILQRGRTNFVAEIMRGKATLGWVGIDQPMIWIAVVHKMSESEKLQRIG